MATFAGARPQPSWGKVEDVRFDQNVYDFLMSVVATLPNGALPPIGPGAVTTGAANDIPISITTDAQGRITGIATEAGTITLSAGLVVTTDVDARRLIIDNGTTLVAGDFAIGAGWGATASIAIAAGSKDTRGEFTITANGAGLAINATAVLTFHDGAFPAAPFVLVRRNGGTGATTEATWTRAAGSVTITYAPLPVAGLTYIFSYMVMG